MPYAAQKYLAFDGKHFSDEAKCSATSKTSYINKYVLSNDVSKRCTPRHFDIFWQVHDRYSTCNLAHRLHTYLLRVKCGEIEVNTRKNQVINDGKIEFEAERGREKRDWQTPWTEAIATVMVMMLMANDYYRPKHSYFQLNRNKIQTNK